MEYSKQETFAETRDDFKAIGGTSSTILDAADDLEVANLLAGLSDFAPFISNQEIARTAEIAKPTPIKPRELKLKEPVTPIFTNDSVKFTTFHTKKISAPKPVSAPKPTKRKPQEHDLNHHDFTKHSRVR